MFDALSERLERLGSSLRSKGRLTDADLDEALLEVRSALLEADVELGVVKAFLDAVRERNGGAAHDEGAALAALRRNEPGSWPQQHGAPHAPDD